MNFYGIENELTPYCLRQFDNNEFVIWDVVCLEQFYDFVGKRLHELEESKKIYKDDVELENEYKKWSALLDEVHEKLASVYQYRQEVEDNGSDFGFERHYDNDEKPIVFENLRKEDITYTPPRLEYIAKTTLSPHEVNDLNDDEYHKNLMDNVNKFSYKNSGGKRSCRKCSTIKNTRKNKVKKSKKSKKSKKNIKIR
jgi:hypothetical protein